MRKFEVYVETSVWGAAADVEPAYFREAAEELLKAADVLAFYASVLVVEEIEAAPEPSRGVILRVFNEARPTVLDNNADVIALADAYVERGVFAPRYHSDATHVACASYYGLPYLVSYNYRHIVRASRKNLIKAANNILGYVTPEMLSPEEMAAEVSED